MRATRLAAALWGAILGGGILPGAGAAQSQLVDPAHRLDPADPEWRELAAAFAKRGDVTASFEERRHFRFRREPLVLRGVVRVSRELGLSLHYLPPAERTVIIDQNGLIMRDASGADSAPADARANAANEALRHVLRFDLAALAGGFEIYGRQSPADWSLALVSRVPAVRKAMGDILVEGRSDAVRRIEIRRSEQQRIDILIAPAEADRIFTAEEKRRYFR